MEQPQRRLDRTAKQIFLYLAWLAPCLIILLLVFRHDYTGLYRSDAMDAAQLARNISNGRGFTTDFIRPLALSRHAIAPAAPDLYQPPLYPLALGIIFTVFPAEDQIVAAASGFFFLLALLVTFFWAGKMFGRNVAGLATLLLAANLTLLQITVAGAATALWVLLITLALYLVYRHSGRLRWSFLIGVVFALCFLTEYLTIFILPAVIWLLLALLPQRRGAHLAAFLVGALLAFAPWGIRNYLLAGSPWFSLRWYTIAMFGGSYPGFSALRELSLPEGSPLGFILAHPAEMGKKLVLGARGLYSSLLLLCGPYVAAFFIAGMLHRFNNERVRRLRGAFYAILLLLVFAAAITTGAAESLAPVAPLITILAVAFVEVLLAARQAGVKQHALAKGLLLIVAGLPVLINLLVPVARPAPLRQNLEQVSRIVPRGALVLSDIPWAVAWYADRTAGWLPSAPLTKPQERSDPTQTAGFAAIDGPEHRVAAIYLSSRLMAHPAAERLAGWQALRAAPEGFRLEAVLPGGDVLLLRNNMLRGQQNNNP